MEVWVLKHTESSCQGGYTETLGVYASEALACQAAKDDIKCRYADNPNAKADWSAYEKQPGIMTEVSIYFGCGHPAEYSWDAYEVKSE